MTRTILISVLIGIVLAGFEGATDAAGAIVGDSHEHSHELHGSAHADNHEHSNDSEHDEHFCHCSVHAAALLSVAVKPILQESCVALGRYDTRFSSLTAPPLLRPPNS